MYWVDLDNTPHVPLFRPILAELSSRGIETLVTSRKHAQTEDLLKLWGIPHTAVGVHGGKSKVRKVANLMHRAASLTRMVKGQDIQLSFSHGSRTHLIASRIRGIPYVEMNDYEFSEHRLADAFATVVMFPAYIPDSRLIAAGHKMSKVIRYHGFKEQIYLKEFSPVEGFRAGIGVPEDAILVTMRPPSTTANYHDARSEALFGECLKHFGLRDDTYVLIVNRTASEQRLVPPAMLARDNVRFLTKSVDGLQLLWHSDIVVSGGGTMNRESALLGIPAYSIFTGRKPYLDEFLSDQGRLRFIEDAKAVHAIPVTRRAKAELFPSEAQDLPGEIVSVLQEIAAGSRRVEQRKTVV